MSGLETVALIAGLAGTAISAAGTIAGGRADQEAAKFQAKQLDIRAAEERAASQREAAQIRKEKNLVLSRQQAVASSSGLGALDPTVLELAGDVEQAGEYRAGLARYGGEERARGNRAQAGAARASGKAAMQGAVFSALGKSLSAAGTIAGGGTSMFSKYGGGGPPTGGPMPGTDWSYGSFDTGRYVYG